jgi:transposase
MTYTFEYIKNTIKYYRYLKAEKIPIKKLFILYTIDKTTFYKWLKDYGNHPAILEKDNIKSERICYYKPNNKKITTKIVNFITDYVDHHPQSTSNEICETMDKQFSVKFSVNHISRIIRDNKYTLKKVQKESIKTTTEQFKQAKEKLKIQIGNKDNRKIICIDEASICLTDLLNYGRSRANTKCIVNNQPKNKKTCFSIIMAISNKKIIGGTLKSGTFNGESFTNFVTDTVLSNIPKNYKILMDNAQIHRCEKFTTTMLINGITSDKFIYNVPYSPKYNPIEYLLNTVKGTIKRQNIRTEKMLVDFFTKPIKFVNHEFENYYKKSLNHLFDDENY